MNAEIEKAQEEAIRAIQRNQQELLQQTMLTPEDEKRIEEIKKMEDSMESEKLSLLNYLRLSGMPNAENVVMHTPKSEYINLACKALRENDHNKDICSSCYLFISDILQKGVVQALSTDNLSAIVNALVKQSDDINLTKQAFAIVTNALNTKSKDIRTFIGKNLEMVVKFFAKYSDDVDIQRGCCFIFSAVVDLARPALEKVNGLKITLGTMKRFPTDPSIQHNCCYVLACLALEPANKDAIREGKGIEMIASVVKRFVSNARIQSYAAYALANLAHNNPTNSAQIRSTGVIKHLVDAFKNFPDDAQTLSNVCYALLTLSEDSEQNIKRMAEFNAPILILNAIRTHAKFNLNVGSNGANALVNILSTVPDKIPEFVDAGGIDVIAKTMAEAVTIIDTQKAFLNLLIIVSQGEDDEKEGKGDDAKGTMGLRRKMGECAAGAIVAAMNGFRNDIEVQMNALIVMSNLIMNCPENQDKFGSKGAVEAILAAMGAHAKVAELQQTALRTLTNLVFKSTANKRRVVAAKGLKTICDAMKAFDPSKVSFDIPRKSEYLTLQSTACMALINTCENSSEAQLAAGECGCLDTVLALAKANRHIAKTCYSTIMIMLSTQKAHARYCTPKFIADIEGRVRGLGDSKDMQVCLAALKRIQDPRAEDAVKRGVCTNTGIPLCKGPCPYKRENGYCVNCVGVQWVRYCATCSKKSNEYLIYCPVCWELHHKGHEGIKLFVPGRCECDKVGCRLEAAKKDTPASTTTAPTATESAPAPEKPKVQQKKQPTTKKQPANNKKQQQKKKAAKKK